MSNKKALVLASGGVDSSTCLGLAVERFGRGKVVALSIYYGQKHDKEIQAANKVSEFYGVEHLCMDLTSIFSDSDCTLLKQSTEQIPEESYEDQLKKTDGNTVSTYVPFRNGLFLATAASIALSKKCEVIYYGAHSDDAAGCAYPDCSSSFNKAMNQAIYEGSGKQLRIEAPFVNKTKSDIVKEGLRLGVPYELTWSCYEGKEQACHKCGTCIDRERAFEKNGMVDPICVNVNLKN